MGKGEFAAGAILAVFAAVVSNVGTNLMKKVHNENEKLPPEKRVKHYKRTKWWVGFGGVVFGAIGDFVALGLASQALVAALGGSVTLMANVVVARRLNNEYAIWQDYAAVVFIVVGAVLFAIIGAAEDTSGVTLDDMEGNFQSAGFVTYAGLQLLVIVLLLSQIATSVFFKWRDRLTRVLLKPFSMRLSLLEQSLKVNLAFVHEELDDIRSELELLQARRAGPGAGAGASPGASRRGAGSIRHLRSRTNAAAEAGQRTTRMVEKLRRLEDIRRHATTSWKDQYIFAMCSGAIGAVSVLAAGCASKSIIEAIQKPENAPFERPLPYVFVAGMVLCIVGQQTLLNDALMLGDIMTVYPVFQALWITLGVAGGLSFYHETLTSYQYALFFLALAAVAVGLYFAMQHGYLRRDRHASLDDLGALPALLPPGGGAGAGDSQGGRGQGQGDVEIEMSERSMLPGGADRSDAAAGPAGSNPAYESDGGAGGQGARRAAGESLLEDEVAKLEAREAEALEYVEAEQARASGRAP
eukprot:g1774.t1